MTGPLPSHISLTSAPVKLAQERLLAIRSLEFIRLRFAQAEIVRQRRPLTSDFGRLGGRPEFQRLRHGQRQPVAFRAPGGDDGPRHAGLDARGLRLLPLQLPHPL